MIKVEPKDIARDGTHFSFICETQEEMDWLKDNQEDVLDRFVQGNFKNIGCLDIHTYKDYLEFGKKTPQEILEDYEGHACRDFGQLEKESVARIIQESSMNMMYTPLTLANLQQLTNDMFHARTREDSSVWAFTYLESLGCTLALDKHTDSLGAHASVYYDGKMIGRVAWSGIYLLSREAGCPTPEFFKFSTALKDDEKFKSTVDAYISAVKSKLLQQENHV